MREKTDLSDRLRRLVEVAGSQRKLAEIVGVTPPAISGWMGGSAPYDSTLLRIAEKTGVSLAWLRDGEGDEAKELEGFRSMLVGPVDIDGARALLREALRRSGMTVKELAKKMGYDAGVVANVVNGSGRASEAMIEAMLPHLPWVTKEELMSGSETTSVMREDGLEGEFGAKPMVQLPAGMRGRMVPLLSMAQAGAWDAGHSDEGWRGEAVFALNVDDRRAFAIRVTGNSMEPDIREGDLVICAPNREPSPGACAVVRTKSGQAFVKFWRRRGDVVTLESSHPDYQALQFPIAEIAGAWPVVQRIQEGMITKQL